MTLKIALLGAESTGKTQLATELVAHLLAHHVHAVQVPEFLRVWCDQHGRTPHQPEQLGIAKAQARAVEQQADQHRPDVLVSDTTPLMTAVYSDYVFSDRSLYPFAVAHQRGYSITLLTGLDLPWVADGLQRDGPHVQEPVDSLLRQALQEHHIPYQVVYGHGAERLRNAILAINAVNSMNSIAGVAVPDCSNTTKRSQNTRPRWACDRCSDPSCEHAMFSRLVEAGTPC